MNNKIRNISAILIGIIGFVIIFFIAFKLSELNASNHEKIIIEKSEINKEDMNQKEENSNQEKEENKKYEYILTCNKTYQELNDEEQGVNYLYMDKLINGEVEYDKKYLERVEELKKQREEIINKKNQEKKVEMDRLYGDIKVSTNIEESIKEVEENINNNLNKTRFYGTYNIKVFESFVNIEFNKNMKLSDIRKGELATISRYIYDYYTDAGLARSETEVKTISVYFIIEGQKYSSHWTLGSSPNDDWNN